MRALPCAFATLLILYTLIAIVHTPSVLARLHNEPRRLAGNHNKRVVANHMQRRQGPSSSSDAKDTSSPQPTSDPTPSIPLTSDIPSIIPTIPPVSTSVPPPDTSTTEVTTPATTYLSPPPNPFTSSAVVQSGTSTPTSIPEITLPPTFSPPPSQPSPSPSPSPSPPPPSLPPTVTSIPPPPLQTSTLPYPTMSGGLPLSTGTTTVHLTTSLVTTVVPILTSYTAGNGVVVVLTSYMPTTYVLVGDSGAIDALGGVHTAPKGAVIGGGVAAAAAVIFLATTAIIVRRRKRASSSRNSLSSDIHSEVAIAFASPHNRRTSGYGSYGESNGSNGDSPYGTSGYSSGLEARRPSFVPRDDAVGTDTEAVVASTRALEGEQTNHRWSGNSTPWLNTVFGEN